MHTLHNISLKEYNTFGLDYKAETLVHIESEKEVVSLLKDKSSWKNPLFVLGGGSNLLFTANFKGTILHPVFTGIRVEKHNKDNVLVSAGAGVKWDDLVDWSVKEGFYGLENLSLIPGDVGASPVQNIGAYGMEVKDLIEKVDTVLIRDGSTKTFQNDECGFAYRSSIFKTKLISRYLVTRVYLNLSTRKIFCLDYGSLKEEVRNLGGESLLNVRQSVINIRKSKLPDPEITGNAGSFFKNPVVTENIVSDLLKKHPKMPVFWEKSGSIKLAAGWLIEQCGWKGVRKGNVGVHEKQALILVNYGKALGEEIFVFSEVIRSSVLEKFGIDLKREVEVVGTI